MKKFDKFFKSLNEDTKYIFRFEVEKHNKKIKDILDKFKKQSKKI